MKKLSTSLILSLLFTLGINAQSIANYSFSTSTGAVLENMTTGTTQLIGPSTHDVASEVTSIGFSFDFMGDTYTEFSVNSNGQMSLGTTVIPGTGITNAALNTPLIVPISDGNAILSTGKVHHKVQGISPNRILIVEWKDLNIPYPIVDNNPPIVEYNPTLVQVYLYENTGAIEFRYGTVSNNSVSSITRATFISSSNTTNTVKYIGADMISAVNGSSVVTYPLTPANTDMLTARNYVFKQLIPDTPIIGVVNNCDGTSTLTASNYTGTLLWSTLETTPSITVSVAGEYSVTQTVDGYTSDADSVVAAPKTAPVAPSVNVVNNCDGTSILTASNYTGTLLWSTAETTASITVTTAATFTVTQTVNGCMSLPGSGIAAPNTAFQASVIIDVDANSVCDGTSVTFTATPTNGGTTPTYQWYNGTSAVGTNSPTFTYTPANGDVIMVVMTSNQTCAVGSPASSNSITITVNPIIVASVTLNVSNNPVSLGSTVTFTVAPSGGGTSPVFRWIRNNLLIPNTGLEYTYTPLDNDEVYVEMTSNASPCLTGSPVNSNIIKMSVSIGTSLDQNGTNKINIYSTDKNIFVNCMEEANQILIYNTLGSLISFDHRVSGLKKFDMSHGVSEYYFVKVVTQYKVYTGRVLLK